MIIGLFLALLAWSFIGFLILVISNGCDQLDEMTERQVDILIFLLTPVFYIIYLIGRCVFKFIVFIAKSIDSLITKQ